MSSWRLREGGREVDTEPTNGVFFCVLCLVSFALCVCISSALIVPEFLTSWPLMFCQK